MKNEGTQKNGNGHGARNLLGFGIAMAIGATMGVLFAPKSGEEMRADTAEQARRIAQKFRRTRAEMAEMIREVFGEVNEELEKDYLEIRGEIMAMVEEMRERGELTKDKYNEAVDRIVSQFAKGRKWSRTAIKKLIISLEEEWNNLTT